MNFYTPWNGEIPLQVLAFAKKIFGVATWVGFLILAVLIGYTIFKAVLRYFR